MSRTMIGFTPSWMDGKPKRIVKKKEEEPIIIIPEELKELRMKVAQLAVFTTTTAFSKLTKNERVSIMLDYTEMLRIERGYTEAVTSASVSLNY